jgi:hypothetical protein
LDEGRAFEQVAQALCREFPAAPDGVIAARIRHARAAFAGARVRDFVPVLVERAVRRELSDRQAVPAGGSAGERPVSPTR